MGDITKRAADLQRDINHIDAVEALHSLGNPQRAHLLRGYFKTGPGEYGEGDLFLGITMPEARSTAKRFARLPLREVCELLHSPFHEARMVALLILCHQYRRGNEELRKEIYRIYLENTRFINNWDLVDASAPKIVGPYLEKRDRGTLYSLAASSLLWERRIAIMATFHFIRLDDYTDALEIAHNLIHDREDLIHKAVGWMLRETGKRNRSVEEEFLQKYYTRMPRTMLRYAIERFPEGLRRRYLEGRT